MVNRNRLLLEKLPEALANLLAAKIAAERGPLMLKGYIEGAVIEDAHGKGLVPFEPWPHLVERLEAWDAGGNEIVLKARQIGVSWGLALYSGWRARPPGSVVLLLSQGQDEAYELLRKVRVTLEHHRFAPVQFTRDGLGYLEITGGGRVIALPSTPKAGRGYTASLIVTDEAAYHPFARMNYTGYKSAVDDGGQHLVVSTANGMDGWFSDMYWDAEARGYRSVFLGWDVRPGRDELWYERAKRGYKGLPAEFLQENPSTPEEAFIALTGLVYHQFSVSKHVAVAKDKWEACKWRLAGIDYGGGDPTAIVTLGVGRGEHVHQYGEFYRSGPVTVDELYAYLMRIHEVAPFDVIIADTNEPTTTATLRSMGLPVWPAAGGVKDRGEGLAMVGFLLDNERLTIDPGCRMSIDEFRGYRWRESTDPNSKDRYATATPVDHHADAMDARRMAVLHLMRSIARGVSSPQWKVSVVG